MPLTSETEDKSMTGMPIVGSTRRLPERLKIYKQEKTKNNSPFPMWIRIISAPAAVRKLACVQSGDNTTHT